MPEQPAQPAPPFRVAAGQPEAHFSRVRVVEGLVIAGIAGLMSAGITSTVVSARLEERISHMQRDLERQSEALESIRRVIYRPSWEQQRGAVLPPDHLAARVGGNNGDVP